MLGWFGAMFGVVRFGHDAWFLSVMKEIGNILFNLFGVCCVMLLFASLVGSFQSPRHGFLHSPHSKDVEEVDRQNKAVEEFNSNQLQTKMKDCEKEDLIAKIEEFEFATKTPSIEIDTLKSEVVEMQVHMQSSSQEAIG